MGGARLVLLGGPTASGKSALALALARRLDGVVINADSLQLYAELRIVTARPGPDALARAPHRLYGVRPAAEPCSVAVWRALARAEIERARADARLPILVGGTGLYFRALLGGLAPVPPIAPQLRARARARMEAIGPAAFHAELAARDPEIAARLAPGDRQRALRAWEVIEQTGRSLADWQRRASGPSGPGGPIARVVLEPPREALYAACDARFEAIARGGGVAEARAFAGLGLDPGLPAMKAVGLRELMAHARGEIGLDEAIAAGQRATRRYAKRQCTWFRHQLAGGLRIGGRLAGPGEAALIDAVVGFVLTGAG